MDGCLADRRGWSPTTKWSSLRTLRKGVCMRGIVFDGEELRLVEGLEVREPGSGEVTVQIVNAGV